jgi:hypothetical protein
MSETTGTDKAPSEAPITPPPGEGPYEDVSGGETTPQSGAGSAAERELEADAEAEAKAKAKAKAEKDD